MDRPTERMTDRRQTHPHIDLVLTTKKRKTRVKSGGGSGGGLNRRHCREVWTATSGKKLEFCVQINWVLPERLKVWLVSHIWLPHSGYKSSSFNPLAFIVFVVVFLSSVVVVSVFGRCFFLSLSSLFLLFSFLSLLSLL